MARLSINKTALHRESTRLKRFQQYLPSLELKRQKLLAERFQASVKLVQTEQSIQSCRNFIAEQLPMLSDNRVDLTGLVKVLSFKIGTEQAMGNPMPVLEGLELAVKPYSTFGQPHWVDSAAVELQRMLALNVQLQIDRLRLDVLDRAVKKITQRVNLFDKILIPKTEMNIKQIRILLADSERAAVVRAKMTKRKQLKGVDSWPS